MRVISGSARGGRLLCAKGLHTRPTSDRAKEALFNLLAFEIRGKSFLDLFSGSGAIGIEALSRGAEAAVFVDSDDEAISALRFNLEKTKLGERAEIRKADALSAISVLYAAGRSFDFIFLDPSYDSELVTLTLGVLAEKNILRSGGAVIAETEASMTPKIPERFRLTDERSYGRTKFIFLEEAR